MKKKFKKLVSAVLTAALAVGVLAGCSSNNSSSQNTAGASQADAGASDTQAAAEPVTVKVGLTGTIYEDIWNPIKEKLAGEGINIELVQFSDFSLPNDALNAGDIDMNAFQHHAYFNNDVSKNGYKISAIADTFVIAMNIYSNKIKDVSEIKDGDKIAIPNDATNGGRAIRLLAEAGVITLSENAGDNPELTDIAEYNKKIEIVEVNAADVCSLLPDVTAAVINGNYALDYGIDPDSAIYFETNYPDDRYFCLIAVRSDEADNEVYKKIVEAFQSEETKQIFKDEFKGFFVPAWDK